MTDQNEWDGRDFGRDFLWGAATAAYQIEGAIQEDGKSLSIWDTFTKKKARQLKGQSGAVACDHYHLWPEDIDLMSQLGLGAYRFSLSWSRIMPAGWGGSNPPGIDFYSRLIDGLLEKGIEPFVTLYHWDLPQVLQDKGGWTNREIIDWFSEYTRLCVSHFGDRVKNWIILNEPLVFTGWGHMEGKHAPGKRGLRNFLPAVHHAIMAQAEASRVLRSENPRLRVGTTISCHGVTPASQEPKDIQAAARFNALMNRLFVDPLVGRGYPVKELPVLRKIQKYVKDDDLLRMKTRLDFLGLNNYTRGIVRHAWWMPYLKYREEKPENPPGGFTDMDWEIYPEGLYQVLKMFGDYPEIPRLYVTENGVAVPDQVDDNGRVSDPRRIDFLKAYIGQILRARREGVPVDGYFVWSLMDNFEWVEGYRPRFGLVYVDYPTQKRIIKDSGYWFRDLIARAATGKAASKKAIRKKKSSPGAKRKKTTARKKKATTGKTRATGKTTTAKRKKSTAKKKKATGRKKAAPKKTPATKKKKASRKKRGTAG